MASPILQALQDLGQSIWYDNISRDLLQSGELARLVAAGVRGVTSNPTIFDKAIAGSKDYDADLLPLIAAGRTTTEIYEALALADIATAADILRPLYDHTSGADGFVSIEVNPNLAHDTAGTIAEARRLFATLSRPNVMIKVPATAAGVPAIATLIGEGINVNVTLIFALAHYQAVANAYLDGLETLAASGGDLSRVASVASFFVSRVDTKVDKRLQAQGETTLQGKIGIANAKIAYARFHTIFSGARWLNLERQGARVQRPLWASTGVKDPRYPDTLYIDNLIGPDTVNTVPPATLEALMDHATVAPTLDVALEDARSDLDRLQEAGIDIDQVTQELQDEGVASFANSFQSLMASIEEKRTRFPAAAMASGVSA